MRVETLDLTCGKKLLTMFSEAETVRLMRFRFKDIKAAVDVENEEHQKICQRKGKEMENEVVEAELVLPTHLNFKKIQIYEKYPKGQSRGRHWKHLKQIIQAENFQSYPPDHPNYVNIETPPSMHPPKRICDITGYEAPYFDPRTKMRFANAEVFKIVRSLPNDYVQRYLALRNAAVVLR